MKPLCLSLYSYASLNTDGLVDKERMGSQATEVKHYSVTVHQKEGVNEMEREEEKEKVLVPVRRREDIQEEEIPEEPGEEAWEIPRRWRVY